jgi:TolB-like protein/lipopolysaccharide biosynthesis regulator YciM
MPNKLSQFWQELKRRKVVRVITVYAAAAFVILELLSIIIEPLKLPEWTLQFAIVFLCIGFIIAVILSWIYDIQPEGGLVKTEPADRVKAEDIPKSSNSWKIASYISFALIVGLVVLNIIPRTDRTEGTKILDKSIAVLPFTSLSDDPEKQYLADGVMDAILLHLSKIEDLRVMSRTSVEQYRVTEKTATEICQELDVAFVLEGSFRKYGDQARLIVQLIQSGKEDHAWANQYDREWKDIFTVESEVAQSIAHELKAVITPNEKQLIEKTPTTNLTAYDFYQRGREEFYKFWLDQVNIEALERAEDLYHEALEYDSTFAQAYTGLAWVYSFKHKWVTVLTEDFLDSMLILADIALSIDDQLAEAYVIRGEYYWRNNKKEQALAEYNKAIEFNPNEWQAYLNKAGVYWKEDDYVKTIDNCYKTASLHRGPLLPKLYSFISSAYGFAGFEEKKIYYAKEALKLDNDSASYYFSLGSTEETNGNFEKAIEFYKKSYSIDSTDLDVIFRLGMVHSYLGLNEEYLEYIKENHIISETLDKLNPNIIFRLGHAYWVNGFKEEAEYFFNEGLRFHNEMLEVGIHYFSEYWTFYSLAAAHAFLADNDKAYENLRLMNQRPRMPKWMIKDLNNDPLFDSIRDEPEFQQIVRDVEAKYQAEHERVRQWLEENDML